MSPLPQKLHTSVLFFNYAWGLGGDGTMRDGTYTVSKYGSGPVHAMEVLPSGCERVVLLPELTASCNDHRQETHTVAICSAAEE